jgi:hypothetical protein
MVPVPILFMYWLHEHLFAPGLGDAAKLKPLEVELKRLEDLSESIVQDFAYMRQREVNNLFFHSTIRISYFHRRLVRFR